MSDRLAVFNDGRIEQVGAPADVYEHPANEFVAGFVGVSNIVEREGAPGHDPARRRSGCSSRREQPGGLLVEEGRIRDVSYAGMITRFVVELDRGGELQVRPAEPRDVLAGGARAEGEARAGRLGRRARVRHPGFAINRGGDVRKTNWRWWTGLAVLTLALAASDGRGLRGRRQRQQRRGLAVGCPPEDVGKGEGAGEPDRLGRLRGGRLHRPEGRLGERLREEDRLQGQHEDRQHLGRDGHADADGQVRRRVGVG